MKQQRSAFSSRLIISLLALMSSCQTLPAQQKHGASMSMGVDSIHAGDICLMLGGNAESGDFFRGLRKRETRNGRTFQRDSKVVKSFPDRLLVRIEAGFDRCAGPGVPLENGCDRCDFRLNNAFMSSLQFEAYWKRGFEMRKAEIDVLSVEQSHDLARASPTAELWKYELSMKSENVPLSDTLIVVMVAPDGRVVSRLSGKL